MLTTIQMQGLIGLLALYLGCSIDFAQAQENAQLQIPPSLVECYNTTYYMDRANRLPSNIETFITLIEKVENSYGYNQDIRQLAVSLIHRFRQDGIQRASGVSANPGVIPYSPTGFQFPKFRILLQRLIPGNAINFPNNTLTSEERCSLHFMLSSSFDTRVRGDENSVCSNLAQYRAQRLPRDLNSAQQRPSNFIGDVEILDSLQAKAAKQGIPAKTAQRLNANAKSYDYEFSWSDYGYNGNNNGNSISQCPVENGVLRTQWGTVAAGNLIAGIAAGLQPQMVPLRTLLSLASKRNGYQNAPQIATVNVDNRWAATLAGDLAEIALVQVPVSTNEQVIVGATGAWNSTVMPKWYFLSQRQNLEMTDAEIRGSIDGLILALNIVQWRNQVSNLKLSQLLRMYYSLDGVLGSGIMACNRMNTFQQINNYQQNLMAQTSAFAQVLDREMQLAVTLSPDSIANFSLSATNALINYLPMNDPSCSVSNALPQDVSQTITPMTNIYVYVDTTWPFYQVQDYINYVLANLNINPYASSVTLLAAADASIIVNTTNFISDIFQGWNYTTHNNYTQGFSLPTILRSIQKITYQYMDGQKANSSVGGRSLLALLVPYMASVSASDSNYATTQLQYLKEQLPDLRFIYYAGGTVTRFSSFVRDSTKDIFPLSPSTLPSTSGSPVVMRIRTLPRRIINPRCGSAWYTSTWGTDQLPQYARPGVINFYRMVPNYFYGAGSGRYLNIQSQNSVQFTVCTSRTVVLPQQNDTSSSSDVTCTQLQGNTFAYDLSNACNGYYTIHQCPPLYVSVQAPSSSSSSSNGFGGSSYATICNDAACQTPDQARYVISVVNLGCFSGVPALTASFATIIFMYLLTEILVCVSPNRSYGQEPEHITNRTNIMTDIFIFLDTYWVYDNIVDYINYAVQRLNIKPYGSSITLLAANDGSIMVNRTFYITEYYANWNRSSHNSFKPGFSLPLMLSKAQVLAETIMKEERNTTSLGGRSMIALLVPSPIAFIYDYDYDYCQKYITYLNNSLPGLRFLYFAGGTIIRFADFVNKPQEDLFLLSYDLEVKAAAEPLVKRIRKEPRRLSNPRCSSHWSPYSTGSNQIIQYAGLGHIQFYRLPAHYFFSEGSMRYLKVKPSSSVAFIVCTSRSNRWPYRDPISPYTKAVDCQQITTVDFSFDLGDLCSNYDTLKDCPPLYLSVQAQSFAETNQLNCKEAACSTPDESEFIIMLNNLDCTNNAAGREFSRQVTYLTVMWIVLRFSF